MRRKNVFLLATFAVLLAACGGKPNLKFGDNEFPVQTVESTGSSTQTTYPAVIKGIQDVEIRPKVSGFITKLLVQEGQTVKAGQLLFVIDNSTFQASVRQAQAAVNSAKSQLQTAKLTSENREQLFKRNVIGQYDLQSAQNTYERHRVPWLKHKPVYPLQRRWSTSVMWIGLRQEWLVAFLLSKEPWSARPVHSHWQRFLILVLWKCTSPWPKKMF